MSDKVKMIRARAAAVAKQPVNSAEQRECIERDIPYLLMRLDAAESVIAQAEYCIDNIKDETSYMWSALDTARAAWDKTK